jgi:hypothetical protein
VITQLAELPRRMRHVDTGAASRNAVADSATVQQDLEL